MPRDPRRPAELCAGPFTVQTAAAHGVTRTMLRGRAWRPLLRGVYVDARLPVTDDLRLAALRLVMPQDAVATHQLAAWLHGAWHPTPGALVPLQLATPRSRSVASLAPEGAHRLVTWPDDVVHVRGMACTSPMRTAFQLMRRAPLVEAVVVADAFAGAGLIDLPWMWAYVDAHRRWPGVEHARVALRLASARSRSPGETRLRMVPVLGGLPLPLVNPPVRHEGRLLAWLDLLLIGRRQVGVEYDGAYHEEARQHAADNRRENGLLVLSGLPVLRYDRFTVARVPERDRALVEMARATGTQPLQQLDPRWFSDPRRPFRW